MIIINLGLDNVKLALCVFLLELLSGNMYLFEISQLTHSRVYSNITMVLKCQISLLT